MVADWIASATTFDSFLYLFAVHATEEKGVGSEKTQQPDKQGSSAFGSADGT